ncbi:MAG TPA: T9SS type A sorting domain-containing protein [Flavobacteriales bacterium]|nr:T9SS type A sorting domain-containing protein [Flavobacteriales bacterium]
MKASVLTVSDAQGRPVFNGRTASHRPTLADVAGWSSGLYVVRITNARNIIRNAS